MKKKSLWLIVLTVVMCLSFSIALAACGQNGKVDVTAGTNGKRCTHNFK